MRVPNIRVRLTAWHGLVLTCTLVGLGVAVYVLMERALLARVDAALDFEFQETAERLRTGRLASEGPSLPWAFQNTYLLRVLDSRGAVLVEDTTLAKHLKTAAVQQTEGGARHHVSVDLGSLGAHRLVAEEFPNKGKRWTIQIATSLEPVQSELRELSRVLWMILPAGLVAATAGGYLLAGRFLAPLGRMTDSVRRISARNLTERLAVSPTRDELRRLAETLNAMLDRIDQAFVATQRFTADAAHELRTPLASIRAEAEVVLLSKRSSEEYEAALRSIVEEVERLSLLSDRLLFLSREDVGGVPANLHAIQLDEVVALAVDDTRPDANRAGVALRFERFHHATVPGDGELLRQVFRNLLENAVKFSRAGGEIVLHSRLEDGMAVVEVRDTGIGIPEDAIPRIFDRFFRVDASRDRRTGGTGLGLSIAKAVVERHQGRLEVLSTVGTGSTFRVVLPA